MRGQNHEATQRTRPSAHAAILNPSFGTYYGANDVPGQNLNNDYSSYGDMARLSKDFGLVVAKGICSYSASELRRVIGLKSDAVREILPRATDEAVHRDYLVLD